MDENKFNTLLEKANSILNGDENTKSLYEWNDFWKTLNEQTNTLPEPPVLSSPCPNSWETIKEILKRQSWNWRYFGFVVCLIVLLLPLGATVFALFFRQCPPKTSEVSREFCLSISPHVSDCCHQGRKCYCFIPYNVTTQQKDVRVAVRMPDRCDNLDMSVSPNGVTSYSYRKYDKLVLTFAIVLIIGTCVAVVFFILYVRKYASLKSEKDRIELEHRIKLADKYVEALSANNRLKEQKYQADLSMAQQSRMHQMDIQQKEPDNWWKYISKKAEIRKVFMDFLLEEEKANSEKPGDINSSEGEASSDYAGEN